MGLTDFFFLLFRKYRLNLLVTFRCQDINQDDSASDCYKALRVTSTHAGLKSLNQATEALKHILGVQISAVTGGLGIRASSPQIQK